MNSKCFVTTIIIGNDPERDFVTLESLNKQTIGNLKIQILRVNTSGELMDALQHMQGEFLHMIPSGTELSVNTYEQAQAVLGENCSACVLPLECPEKSGHISAMNSYIKKPAEQQNLEVSYRFIHSCYCAFVLRNSAALIRSAHGEMSSLVLLIWRILYETIVREPELLVAEQALCEIPSTRALSEVWSQLRDKAFSSQMMEEFLLPIHEFCQNETGICEKHARYVLMYYLNQFEKNFASEDMEYYRQIKEQITLLMREAGTPELFVNHLNFSRERKNYFLNDYLEDFVRQSFQESEDQELIHKYEGIRGEEKNGCTIQFLKLERDKAEIWGCAKLYGDLPFEIQMTANGEACPVTMLKKEEQDLWFDEVISRTEYFQAELSLEETQSLCIKIICRRGETTVEKLTYGFGKFAPLDGEIPFIYRKNGWMFSYNRQAGSLTLEPENTWKVLLHKVMTLASLLKRGKAGWKAIPARFFYGCMKRENRRIWLISDRVDRADDNGEVFFRYLQEQPPEDVELYFVLGSDSPDYKRMKQYGKVVPAYSWRHKLYHLCSEYVISSQGNDAVVNPFGRGRRNYKDIFADRRFVFLQHGVTKDDQSAWLNRYNRNIHGLVVTTWPEYRSMLDCDYYYTPKEIWLTGMPRYDRLYHDEKKYVTVLPTWRKSLAGGTDSRGIWQIGEDFTNSQYFQFYQKLLNHPYLLERAAQLGYQICFMPHPNTVAALPAFHLSPQVQVFRGEKSYQEIFAESDLMVTDYSSVAFDFAYLQKPVIYCQFDKDAFFEGGHSYTKGYFDYERDGFGEVEETLVDSVNRIVEYMENGCQVKEKYRKRMEETFPYRDQLCCERVLEKLLKS